MNDKMPKLVFQSIGHIIVKWLLDVSTNSKGLFCDPIFPLSVVLFLVLMPSSHELAVLNVHIAQHVQKSHPFECQ